MGEELLLELKVPADWDSIGRLRRLVESMTEAAAGNPDSAARIGLAAHELLENAIKYGRGPAQLKLRVDAVNGELLALEVSNRAEPAEAARLDELLRELAASGSDVASHMRHLHAAMATPGRSRLGLVRVWFEAQLDLTSEYKGGICRITAVPRAGATATITRPTVPRTQRAGSLDRSKPLHSTRTPTGPTRNRP